MDVFDFYDYRKFLAAWYDAKKALNKNFSYRSFALKAGYKSPGYYLDIVKGHKNLSHTMALSFADAMKLEGDAKEYFLRMVQYGNAEDSTARSTHFDRMSELMPARLQELRESQRDYYRHWHNIAVREALDILSVYQDYAPLAAFIEPPLSLHEASKSIELLARLGMIHRDAQGAWRSVHSTVGPGDTAPVDDVRQFQKDMMRMGAEALERFPRSQRNVSCVTFSVSPEGMQKILAKVDQLRKEILDVVRADSGETRVMQLNVQAFPLSKDHKDEI